MVCPVIQVLPRAVVEFFHGLVNVLVGYVLKTAALGKVLPDQAIGVFVQTTVRMGEIDVRIQRCFDSFVPGTCDL